MFSKSKSPVIVFILILFLIVGFQSTLWAASAEEEREAKLIAEAKKEGTLSIYTNTATTAISLMIQKFQDKYPFIKTELYRSGAPKLMSKILSETKAGVHKADVIGTEGLTGYLMMKKGLYLKYISPHSKVFPEGTKDPEGYWTSVYNNYKVICYNARLVPPEDAPKTWEELLQPKWKGKLLFAINNYEWFGNMLKIMGEEKGLDFMKKLAGQNLLTRSGGTLTVTLIIAGEGYASIASNVDKIEELKAQGAPIDWVGADPVINRLHPLAIARKAPHPNAAKLWVDFVLSREGQKVVASTFRIPARPGVETIAPRLAEPIKTYAADLSLADSYAEVQRKFDKIFRSRRR